MDDSDRLRAGHILLSAMWFLKPRERWPTDDRLFANTVDKLAPKGNTFAAKFPVLTRVNGRYCPDFREMMTLAKSAAIRFPMVDLFMFRVLSWGMASALLSASAFMYFLE